MPISPIKLSSNLFLCGMLQHGIAPLVGGNFTAPFSVLQFPMLLSPVCRPNCAKSVNHTHLPGALIVAAILESDIALTVRFTVDIEFSHVQPTIGRDVVGILDLFFFIVVFIFVTRFVIGVIIESEDSADFFHAIGQLTFSTFVEQFFEVLSRHFAKILAFS